MYIISLLLIKVAIILWRQSFCPCKSMIESFSLYDLGKIIYHRKKSLDRCLAHISLEECVFDLCLRLSIRHI